MLSGRSAKHNKEANAAAIEDVQTEAREGTFELRLVGGNRRCSGLYDGILSPARHVEHHAVTFTMADQTDKPQ